MYKVLVTLCVLALALSADAACVNGVQGNGYPCICRSGYTGSDCSTFVTGCTANTVSATGAKKYPYPDRLPGSYGFTQNNLWLSVLSPIVTGRDFTSVTFKNAASDICSVNSTGMSVWTQLSNSGPVCRDEFRLSLPWANKTTCGFVINNAKSTDSLAVYSATIIMGFRDNVVDIGSGFGGSSRISKTAYDVNVAFPKKLTLEMSPVNVNGPLQANAVLTGYDYHYSTHILDLTLTSVMAWPNRLNDSSIRITSLPASISQSGIIVVDSSRCNTTAGTKCVQTIMFSEIYANDICSFDGSHVITAEAATCREQELGCTHATQTFTFTIVKSNACGSVMAVASVSAALIPLALGTDYPAATPSNIPYVLGTTAKFLTTINAGPSNTVTATYQNITLYDVRAGVTTVLLANGVVTAAGAQASLVTANSQRGFSMFVHPRIFNVDPFDTKTFILSALIKLDWAGNELYAKRSIEQEEQEEEVLYAEDFLESYASTTALFTPSTTVTINKYAPPSANVASGASFQGVPLTHSVVAVAGAGAFFAVAVIAAVVIVLRKRSASSN